MGLDAQASKECMHNYEAAVRIGGLYAYRPPPTPAQEESASIGVAYPTSFLEAELLAPGPLPLVSGSSREAPQPRVPLSLPAHRRRRCLTLKEYESRSSSIPISAPSASSTQTIYDIYVII